MDENDPENATNLLSYLLREQYEKQPLIYGQYYNAPTRPRSEFGNMDPLYSKDEKSKNYKILDARKNAIPKYEKEFCTIFPRMWSNQSQYESGYRYWGNVAEHHRNKVVENNNGETESVEIPTMWANLTYFFRYQINYMYLRYFYWNYVGRQNDFQGLSGNNSEGNWVSGIKPIDDFKLDTDTSKKLYRYKNNFAENHFYALPLILGLFGMVFQFKQNKQSAWIVMCFFILTGLAIVVFLNQQPQQPRERDYAYPGSFYAFAIWIGLGVLFIFEKLSKSMNGRKTVVIAIALCLIVPLLMAKDGWNDHDRSRRTMSRDCAANYLQSCAPNAILFTNGDNDTFPLWYAQEVEGIRTDIRVVCLSLLNTDWCIKQLRRAAYDGASVPFTVPQELVEGEKKPYVIINRRNKAPMNLKDALASAINEDPNSKIDNGGELIDVLPSANLYLDVDSETVIKQQVVPLKDTTRIVKRITWELPGRNYITKSDLMVLDILAHNNWQRPLYFTSSSNEPCQGLSKYLQAEGLVYRLVPIEQTEQEATWGGRVNTEAMYNNMMNKYAWGGMSKEGVYLDETSLGMAGNLRMNMIILAEALINEGKKDKAKRVLDKCLEEMPDENVPFDARIYTVCGEYYELGDLETANKLAKKLFDMFENDLEFYNVQEPNRRSAYTADSRQAKDLLKNLISLTQHYKQEELTRNFTQRIQHLLGPEDYETSAPQQVTP
jgi:tetratricopeptide (TPR) repeat protein